MISINTVIKVVLGLIGVGLLLLALSWANHLVKTSKDIPPTPIRGKLVEVNGHRMHVWAQGEGRKTLILMAGSGTSAPALDFKPLWTELIRDYRIVVVEKAGYGFSDVAKGVSRDIDTILAEYRQALQLAGETSSPFVLVAHSMSALEAIYWANRYPDEVQAIMGIDPAIPETYQHMQMLPLPVLRVLSFLASAGVTRFIPSIANSPVVESGYLSEQEKTVYQELVHRRTLSANMVEEIRVVTENARTVAAAGVPVEVPMLFFISHGKETGVDQWQQLLVDYAQRLNKGDYLLLDAGHYLHHHEPAFMVDQMKSFLHRL